MEGAEGNKDELTYDMEYRYSLDLWLEPMGRARIT